MCACIFLKEVNISDKVEEIGDYAFEGIVAEKIELPESVKRIGAGAFYNCGMIRKISANCGARVIGRDTFGGCHFVSEIILPEDCREIRKGAFTGCSVLRELILPESVEEVQKGAFDEKCYIHITAPAKLKESEGLKGLNVTFV